MSKPHKTTPQPSSETMTRKEALQAIGRYGKYAALTALGTFVILNPKAAQAASVPPPGDGFFN